jgi:urease accessory protein
MKKAEMKNGMKKPEMQKTEMKILFAVVATLFPVVAWAHPGHGGSGFLSGLAHPFSGLDHILCMLAVGIWAARNGGARGWFVVAAFLLGMLAGGVTGLDGILPSFLESAVAASVLAATLLVALAVRLPLAAQSGTAAFFALWHGIAHGAELPAMTAPLNYACGFLLATTLLLGSGMLIGKMLQNKERDRWLGAGMATLAAALFWT